MEALLRSHFSLHTPSGGASRLIKNVATALAESGWEITILCPLPTEESGTHRSKISFSEFSYGNPQTSAEILFNTVRGARTYKKIVDERDFDVVLDDVSHYPFFPAHFLCPEQTTNAVFMHIGFFGAAREFIGPLRGTVIDLIDQSLPYLNQPEIVCAGPSTEQRLQSKLDYCATHILNPCINIDKFEYNFAPESTQILYLGRLGVRKNVSCLLRAWQIVETNTECELELVIAGTGTEEAALHTLRDELELEHVDFRGYVDEAKKRQLYRDSLLYVLPSKMEGYVTTGIEALAAGTPVVGSDTYGIRDYIRHGETGYLFPVDDHEALAELLLELVSDPSQMQPVAMSGRELACEHDYDVFKSKAESVFTTLATSE